MAATALGAKQSIAEFKILHAFNGLDGMDAYSQVRVHQGRLYTTAVRGGKYGKGTLVALDLSTGEPEVLHHFNGTDGRAPFNLGPVHRETLWGVTRSDERNYKGTLFSYSLNTSQASLERRFEGAPHSPDHPMYGPLVLDDTVYGMSNFGGAHNQGALYRFSPKSHTLDLLHSFKQGDGTRPFAGLIYLDGWLVGTASDITLRKAADPPNKHFGVIFRIRPDGSDYQVVHRFQGGNRGGHPYGNLLLSDDGLYGTTLGEYNDIDDQGVLFRIDRSFQHYQVIHDFSERDDDGSKPNGDLILSADGQTLYGFSHGTITAPLGDTSPFYGVNTEPGTLFSLSKSGEHFHVLHRFDSIENGLVPERTPVLYKGVIYGASAGGGQYQSADRPGGMGTIFSYHLESTEADTASGAQK